MRLIKNLVTIGVPIYNESEYILRTINSVLNQSYLNIELIICDNCSTDDTLNKLDKYLNQGSIKYFRHSSNIGPSENFKFALKNASGEFFMWLGGHDYIHRNYVLKAIELHQINPKSSLVYYNHQFVSPNNDLINTPELGNIATDNLNRKQRVIKAYKHSSGYCTHIHGIWRTKLRKKILFKNIIGPDRFQLILLALNGSIHYCNENWYFRTMNNINETETQSLRRYNSSGLKFDESDPYYTLYKAILDYMFCSLNWLLFYDFAKLEKIRFKKYFKEKVSTFF